MDDKYEFQSDLRVLEWLVPPSTNLPYILGNPVLKILHKSFRSDKECSVSRKRIPTFDGKQITLYIIEPKSLNHDEKSSSILYMHGGGFVYSAVPYQWRYAREYALATNSKVFFVDYRLLPKNKYPIPLLDCLSVYEYMINNSQSFNLDLQKIILAGDSAGGFLAASLFFKLRAKNYPLPCGCLLIYPVLDQRMKTESMQIYDDTPMWDAKANKRMWELLIDKIPCVSPSEETDLSSFPCTYLETAEYDCLRDEGIEFAERLQKEGVQVITNFTKGTYHGYDAITKSEAAHEAILKRITALKIMLSIK